MNSMASSRRSHRGCWLALVAVAATVWGMGEGMALAGTGTGGGHASVVGAMSCCRPASSAQGCCCEKAGAPVTTVPTQTLGRAGLFGDAGTLIGRRPDVDVDVESSDRG